MEFKRWLGGCPPDLKKTSFYIHRPQHSIYIDHTSLLSFFRLDCFTRRDDRQSRQGLFLMIITVRRIQTLMYFFLQWNDLNQYVQAQQVFVLIAPVNIWPASGRVRFSSSLRLLRKNQHRYVDPAKISLLAYPTSPHGVQFVLVFDT